MTTEEIAGIHWFHSIDLGNGLVTPGAKSPAEQRRQLDAFRLPDLKGKTVLDIGAWDGYFSFEAERRGAARVVALDYQVWCLDHHAQREYVARCRARGESPQHYEEVPSLYHPDRLPGKAGFDLAHRALRSRVEAVVGDFMTMDLEPLGTFDVVLFLGVLYHMPNPLEALRRVASLTAGVCVIETLYAHFPSHEHRQVWEFFETDEFNSDPSNWWAGNAQGLQGLARAAGFSRAEVVDQYMTGDRTRDSDDVRYGRAVMHAFGN